MELLVYVLHGSWNTQETDGVKVLGVSFKMEPLLGMLDGIAASNASDYVKMHGYFQTERDERYYEIIDKNGQYAKFYITEHNLVVEDYISEIVYAERKRRHILDDAKNAIMEAYGNGEISRDDYEISNADASIANMVADWYEKTEDCNVPINDSMNAAVKSVFVNMHSLRDGGCG